MRKETINWLMYTPAHDVYFIQHLADATIQELQYVLTRLVQNPAGRKVKIQTIERRIRELGKEKS